MLSFLLRPLLKDLRKLRWVLLSVVVGAADVQMDDMVEVLASSEHNQVSEEGHQQIAKTISKPQQGKLFLVIYVIENLCS